MLIEKEEAQDKENNKKSTVALVLGIIAIVILAGSKLIFGASFFYLVALILAVIAFIFAYKTTRLTKKAVIALIVATTPMIVAGYNLVGISARDFIIDAEIHHIEHEAERDVRDVEDFLPDMERDLGRDADEFNQKVRRDAEEFQQKVKEDAAKQDTASASQTDETKTK